MVKRSVTAKIDDLPWLQADKIKKHLSKIEQALRKVKRG